MQTEPRLARHIQTGAVILAALLSCALYWLVSEHRHHDLLEHVEKELTERAELRASRIEAAADALTKDVLFLSLTPPVQGILRADGNGGIDPRDNNRRGMWVQRLQEIFAAFLDTRPDYYQVRFIGVANNGRELVRVERRDDHVESTPDHALQAEAGQDYFRSTIALPEANVHLSEVSLNRERGQIELPHKRTLRASTPVYGPDGQVFGMIIIHMDMAAISLFALDSPPYQAQSYLSNEDGYYLSHPDPRKTFGFEFARDHRITRDLPGLSGDFQSSKPPLRTLDSPDGPVLVLSRKARFDPTKPERFILLTYVVPRSALLDAWLRGNIEAASLSLMLGLALGGALYWWLRRSFHPLRQLTASARRLADGHLDQPMPELGGGELGLLAGAMEQLRQRVGERETQLLELNASLDERVQQRTAALKLAENVIENTSEGVMVTDTRGRIVAVNPAFTRITQYTAEEVLGQSPNLLKSEHHEPDFYRSMWEDLRRDGHWSGDIWNRRKDGEAYLERLTINLIPAEGGQPDHYVGVFNDITELRRKDERIERLAFHDALTGLPNRTLLQDRLGHAIRVAARESRRLAVMLMDLDRFKGINDTLGHNIGDQLLQAVAGRLRSQLRASDTVARMGGDEFVILLEQQNEPEHCASLARELVNTVSSPLLIGGHQVQVGASLGIACYPDDGDDGQTLLRNADAAMYAAKRQGRGMFQFFQASMAESASQRLRLEMELRRAVQQNEFELHYQPKVCLKSGGVTSAEALVRWRHPQLGLVPPDEFIPVAEETGMILELGEWVLKEAYRQAADWLARDIHMEIAVNISALQLRQPDMAGRILELARSHAIPADAIQIELTESLLMADPERAIQELAQIRAIGLGIAVDDFGTGYSSLSYLRRLPLNVLKIDRSFVREADSRQEDAQIVRAILAMARALGLATVAEGVETEAQAALLREAGCDFAQGYLYAKPQPAAELEAWLARFAST